MALIDSELFRMVILAFGGGLGWELGKSTLWIYKKIPKLYALKLKRRREYKKMIKKLIGV